MPCLLSAGVVVRAAAARVRKGYPSRACRVQTDASNEPCGSVRAGFVFPRVWRSVGSLKFFVRHVLK